MHIVRSSIALWIGLACLAGCGGGDGNDGAGGGSDGGAYRSGEDGGRAVDINPKAPQMVSLMPDNLGDGWQTSTPAAQGIDTASLQRWFDYLLANGSGGVDGVVIVRNDQLVAE